MWRGGLGRLSLREWRGTGMHGPQCIIQSKPPVMPALSLSHPLWQHPSGHGKRKHLSWGQNDEGQVCWGLLQALYLPTEAAAPKADLGRAISRQMLELVSLPRSSEPGANHLHVNTCVSSTCYATGPEATAHPCSTMSPE